MLLVKRKEAPVYESRQYAVFSMLNGYRARIVNLSTNCDCFLQGDEAAALLLKIRSVDKQPAQRQVPYFHSICVEFEETMTPVGELQMAG